MYSSLAIQPPLAASPCPAAPEAGGDGLGFGDALRRAVGAHAAISVALAATVAGLPARQADIGLAWQETSGMVEDAAGAELAVGSLVASPTLVPLPADALEAVADKPVDSVTTIEAPGKAPKATLLPLDRDAIPIGVVGDVARPAIALPPTASAAASPQARAGMAVPTNQPTVPPRELPAPQRKAESVPPGTAPASPAVAPSSRQAVVDSVGSVRSAAAGAASGHPIARAEAVIDSAPSSPGQLTVAVAASSASKAPLRSSGGGPATAPRGTAAVAPSAGHPAHTIDAISLVEPTRALTPASPVLTPAALAAAVQNHPALPPARIAATGTNTNTNTSPELQAAALLAAMPQAAGETPREAPRAAPMPPARIGLAWQETSGMVEDAAGAELAVGSLVASPTLVPLPADALEAVADKPVDSVTTIEAPGEAPKATLLPLDIARQPTPPIPDMAQGGAAAVMLAPAGINADALRDEALAVIPVPPALPPVRARDAIPIGVVGDVARPAIALPPAASAAASPQAHAGMAVPTNQPTVPPRELPAPQRKAESMPPGTAPASPEVAPSSRQAVVDSVGSVRSAAAGAASGHPIARAEAVIDSAPSSPGQLTVAVAASSASKAPLRSSGGGPATAPRGTAAVAPSAGHPAHTIDGMSLVEPTRAPAPASPVLTPAALAAAVQNHPASPPARIAATGTNTSPELQVAALLAAMPQAAGETPREAPRAAPMPPARQVLPMAIAMLISPGASPTLSVTLEPGELGRLEIRVTRDNGGAGLRLIAERPETLGILLRDQRELQQGLAQSGITLNAEGISFEMAGQGGQARHDQPSPRPRGRQPSAEELPGHPSQAAQASLLDMRI